MQLNKSQALHDFWSGFELPAFDESTVPTGATAPPFPYITYSIATDSIGNDIGLSGSLWYRSTSWTAIDQKAEEIEKALYDMTSPIKIDGGFLWLKRGSPFARRMSDPNDDMIRRIYINITAEFLTAY